MPCDTDMCSTTPLPEGLNLGIIDKTCRLQLYFEALEAMQIPRFRPTSARGDGIAIVGDPKC